MQLRSIARAILGSLIVLSACGPEGDPSARPTKPPNNSTGRCEFPNLEPTYLPWGDASAPPRRDYDRELDRAALIWTNPKDSDDQVALSVYPLDEVVSAEKPLGVTIQGAKGYLHRGSFGENSAWWDLDADCNFLELSVSLDGRSPKRVDREVEKVARSLRRSTSR